MIACGVVIIVILLLTMIV